MTVAISLLLGVVLVTWLSPVLLRTMLKRHVDPTTALASWTMLVTGSLLTGAVGVVLAFLPGHGFAPQIVDLMHDCWVALKGGSAPQLHEIMSVVSIGTGLLIAGRLVHAHIRHVRHQRRVHRRQTDLLRVAAQPEAGAYTTMWLNHPHPFAYSIGGTRPFIVATRGLAGHLSDEELASVLEHERSHLRGRHHTLVGLAKVLAAALPWIPLTRYSPQFVSTMVELAADMSAARRHGPRAVRSALTALSKEASSPPPLALGAASDHVQLRLEHLAQQKHNHGRVVCGLRTSLAATTATLTPLAFSAAVFLLGTLSLCPLLLCL